MKTLNKYINESLLDDLDSLESGSDMALSNTITKSSDFINVFGDGWVVKDNKLISPSQEFWRRNNKFRYAEPIIDLMCTTDEVDELFDNVDTIDINFNRCAIKNNGQLAPYNFCKNINHNGADVLTLACHEIKDINVSSRGHGVTISNYLREITLNNVNITFNAENKHKLLHIANEAFPIFKNVKSNAEEIRIYDCFIFDKEKTINDINNLLDLPYKVKVYDNAKKTEVDIPIKTFKKIHAIANNKKRYKPLEPLFRPKPNAKLNDLFNVSGFNNLKDVIISNNLISIRLSISDKRLPSYNIEETMKFKLGDWYGVVYKKT